MNTKTRALILLGTAGLVLTGCGRHSRSEVFYLITSNAALPYWKTAAAGFQHAAAAYNVQAKIEGPDGYDPQAELAALRRATNARPAGILISVADASVLQPGIDAAVNAGIPVITVDSDASASRRLFFIGTNNLEAGRLAGRRISDRLTKGNLLVFTIAGQPNTDERLEGLRAALSTKAAIKVTDVIDVKGDAREAFDRALQAAAQTGVNRIDGFLCLDSASGKVVADALKRANVTDRLLVAWDVNQDTLNGIKAGIINATVAQKPYSMGYVGLKSLDEIHHAPPKDLARDFTSDSFSPYPTFVDTGTSVVDQGNVDAYIAAAQNQK